MVQKEVWNAISIIPNIPEPGDVPGSPRHRFRHRVRQFGGLLAATAVLVTGGVIAAGPASAASVGPGHGDLNTTGTVGALIAESDGRQVYCMDAGAPAPWNMTSGPTTVTDLTSYTGQQLSPTTLAKLNYVMAKWGDSTNPDITAAVQMYVWAEAVPVTYQTLRGKSRGRSPGYRPAHQSTVLANLATYVCRCAMPIIAVNPSVDVVISMADQYNGTLTVNVSPTALNGRWCSRMRPSSTAPPQKR